MTPRDVVLARVRSALQDRPSPAPVQRDYRRAGLPGTDLVALLRARVTDYRAEVVVCGEHEAGDAVRAALERRGSRRVVLATGLPTGWGLVGEADDPELDPQELDRVDAVVTTCLLAIAETGTVVLDHGPGQGRRALTLIPDHHVLVVRADQIVSSVPEAIAALDPRRTMTWVSGPSATSDIELSRVEGVHGPRLLDVVILSGA